MFQKRNEDSAFRFAGN